MVNSLPQNPSSDSSNAGAKLTSDLQATNSAATGITQPVNQSVLTPKLPKQEQTGSLFKEGEPRIVEKKDFKPPAEVKEWVTEIKEAEEINLPQPIKDDFGQILVESATPTKPQIVLPLTQVKTKKGLHHKIADSIRWLAEWCWRLIKMFPKRAVYKELT
jgi:hypothetical protein